MSQEVTERTKQKMLAVIEHLKVELKSIRTGRANPSMLDGVTFEAYGAPMRLKEAASVNAADARQLVITPFDPKNVGPISKAIEKANLGVMPIADGNVVRIKIPPMDESTRKEMVKISHKRREDAKVTIRNIRRDMNEEVRKKLNLPEDQIKKSEKSIQELTDKFCIEVDQVVAAKEKEIMTI